MDERATGIIVRTRPLTETSLIVHWLTLEAGRISTVAKGARRPKSAFSGKLDLYYDADLSFVRSGRSTLHNLREVTLRSTRADLRNDIDRLTAAAKATRRLEKTTEEDTSIPELYELFRAFLDELAAGPHEPILLLAFEFKLLSALGLEPQLPSPQLNPGETRALEQLRGLAWPALRRLKLTPAQTSVLGGFLDAQFRSVA